MKIVSILRILEKFFFYLLSSPLCRHDCMCITTWNIVNTKRSFSFDFLFPFRRLCNILLHYGFRSICSFVTLLISCGIVNSVKRMNTVNFGNSFVLQVSALDELITWERILILYNVDGLIEYLSRQIFRTNFLFVFRTVVMIHLYVK